MFFLLEVLCVFQFFITDNFYVQQKEPYFDSNQNSNITVLENESVVLKCIVRNKGNKTVSQNYFWYLKLHIFSSSLAPPPKMWCGDFLFLFHLFSPTAHDNTKKIMRRTITSERIHDIHNICVTCIPLDIYIIKHFYRIHSYNISLWSKRNNKS